MNSENIFSLENSNLDFESLKKDLVSSVRQKAQESRTVQEAFFEKYSEQIVEASRIIAESYKKGGSILVAGNGGSACDAAHIAVEFNHPITAGRPALNAVDLTADTALLTALVNDVGKDYMFARQIFAKAKPQDVLIAISTSGNSSNLLEAFATAKKVGMSTIALVGCDGGKMKDDPNIDFCFIVDIFSVHRVQEVHLPLYHILWDLTHTFLSHFDRQNELVAV